MFNIVEKHQKLVKGIMITLTATFVVWGVSGYLGMAGDDGYVAKVGSNKLYLQDIDRAMDQNPSQGQDKMQVLFGLINRQLLLNSIDDNHMTVTTKQLQSAIAAIPVFQTDGAFDPKKYEDFLKQRYMTSASFEKDMANQELIQDYLDFFKNSYFSSNAFESKFAEILSRERNVSQYVIDPKQFYSKINPSESDIAAYYQQNIAKFTVPDQVKLQYIQLSTDAIAKTVKVSDDEVSKYIQDHPASVANEQVDVSHILFAVPADATSAQKAEIKAKAQKVLSEIKANPAKFAALAKQYSEDPGSAANGGDLGYFGKGVMVKPFEQVAFNMKKGQISDLVETQYGYHILKLNDIKGNDIASQKATVIALLQKQKASTQLQSSVEKLNDVAYNQPDSLTPAANKVGATIQSTDWLSKGAASGLLANPKLQQALFTDDVLKKHHNSEVVDMGDGSYVVARVTDYQAAKQKPLTEVRSQIIDSMKADQAAQMATQMGQMNLAQLQQGKLKLNFTGSDNVTITGNSKNIDPMAVRQIFTTPATSFPAYTGAANKTGGFVIYRINSQTIDKSLISKNLDLLKQMSAQNSMMTLNAYIGALRSNYNVSYKLDRIKNADSQTNQGVSGN